MKFGHDAEIASSDCLKNFDNIKSSSVSYVVFQISLTQLLAREKINSTD